MVIGRKAGALSESGISVWIQKLGLSFDEAARPKAKPTPAAPRRAKTIPLDEEAEMRKENLVDLIPAYKSEYLTRKDDGLSWGRFQEALHDNDLMLGLTERFVFPQIFAAEGGFEMAPGGSAVGGIMNDTMGALLKDKRDDPFVQKLRADCKLQLAGRSPDELTGGLSPDLLPRLYVYDLDKRFRALPQGRRALEDVGNHYAAASMADTLFRFGDRGGAHILAAAVNKLSKGKEGFTPIQNPDLVGPVIFKAYSDLAKNPATLQPLLDAVAEERGNAVAKQAQLPKFQKFAGSLIAGEAKRSEHFRFAEREGLNVSVQRNIPAPSPG